MRKWGKVHTKFWIDEKVKELSVNGKLLLLYLLTGPHTNAVGCFRLPVEYISGDLDWDHETVTNTLTETVSKGLIVHNMDSHFVHVRNFLRHNKLDNANVAKHSEGEIDLIPRSPEIFIPFFESIKSCKGRFDKEFWELLEKDYDELFETLSGTVTNTVKGTVAQTVPKGFKEHIDIDLDIEKKKNDKKKKPQAYSPEGINRGKKSKKSKSDLESKFEKFWEEYGNKKSKPRSFISFKKALQKVDLDTILKSIKPYKAYLQESGIAQKYPATWLNQECWNDDYGQQHEEIDKNEDQEKLKESYLANLSDSKVDQFRKSLIQIMGWVSFSCWFEKTGIIQQDNQIKIITNTSFKASYIKGNHSRYLDQAIKKSDFTSYSIIHEEVADEEKN